MNFTVQKGDPRTLVDFVAARTSSTRRAAKAAIDARRVWVERRCVWIAKYALNAGDRVEIAGAAPGRPAPAKTSSHVRILWQDDDYLVCDKPAGVVSCGETRSVESALRAQEGIASLEAVHRLDRDTTGCLLFAKRREALDAAVEVFKSHRVSKTYHAIALGRVTRRFITVDAPLDGQPAVSRIALEAAGDGASFLRVRIETGRTNQIRRHLASLRHPVVGDRVFGMKSANDPRLVQVPRQMLHASGLALAHPLRRGAEIAVHSPLPADFRAGLRLFGMGRRQSPAGGAAGRRRTSRKAGRNG